MKRLSDETKASSVSNRVHRLWGGGSSHLEVWNSKRKIGIRIPGEKRSGEENENENQTKTN